VPYSALSHLDCPRCGARHDADLVQGTCSCGSPLLARYDLDRVGVCPRDIAGRPPDLWRYHELLPVRAPGRVVSLGEGMTPLIALPRLGRALGVPNLLMKDEGLIPTGTFKARGAAVGISRAAELGVSAIAMPTNGNAGAAWSMYAARAGMRCLVVMPEAAPAITRAECAAAGAELYLVDGLIADAGKLVAGAVASRPGYQDTSTLREPYRIEGKKTMGLEIAEQLGWRLPGVIVYPTGGGVGIIGIYKALRELLELGWVHGDLPRLVAVQATGCAPIVQAFQAGAAASEPWPDAKTVAFGITVPNEGPNLFTSIASGRTLMLMCPAMPELIPCLKRQRAAQHRSNFNCSLIVFLRLSVHSHYGGHYFDAVPQILYPHVFVFSVLVVVIIRNGNINSNSAQLLFQNIQRQTSTQGRQFDYRLV